jgi:hypothetical protein
MVVGMQPAAHLRATPVTAARCLDRRRRNSYGNAEGAV